MEQCSTDTKCNSRDEMDCVGDICSCAGCSRDMKCVDGTCHCPSTHYYWPHINRCALSKWLIKRFK